MTTVQTTPTLASLLAEEEAALVRRGQLVRERCKNMREGFRLMVAATLPAEIWQEMNIDFAKVRLTNARHLTYIEAESLFAVGDDIPLLAYLSACSGWQDYELTFCPAIAQPREMFDGSLTYHPARPYLDGTFSVNLSLVARALYQAIKAHRILVERYPDLLKVAQ